jgi:hypothetical protein
MPRRAIRSAWRSAWRSVWLSAMLAAGVTGPACAFELTGTRNLVAQLRGPTRVVLGQVSFTPQADGRIAFKLAMDPARFTDHFLSMKEFKCLDAGGELLCHVPYPYPQPGSVTAGDLAWLEHALLFLFKKPGEFGAKLWNGLYFKFERTPQGLVGRPQAIDLNLISAPPDKPGVPPYRPALRDDVPDGARAIERLLIE